MSRTESRLGMLVETCPEVHGDMPLSVEARGPPTWAAELLIPIQCL